MKKNTYKHSDPLLSAQGFNYIVAISHFRAPIEAIRQPIFQLTQNLFVIPWNNVAKVFEVEPLAEIRGLAKKLRGPRPAVEQKCETVLSGLKRFSKNSKL